MWQKAIGNTKINELCAGNICFSLLRPCCCGRMVRISHLGSSRRRVSHLYTGAQKWLLCLRRGTRLGFFTGETDGRTDEARRRVLCWVMFWGSWLLWTGAQNGASMCVHVDTSPAQTAQGRCQVFLFYEWKKDPAVTWQGHLQDGSGCCWTLSLWKGCPDEDSHLWNPTTEQPPMYNTAWPLWAYFFWSSFLSSPSLLLLILFHGFPLRLITAPSVSSPYAGSWDYCWEAQRSRLWLADGRQAGPTLSSALPVTGRVALMCRRHTGAAASTWLLSGYLRSQQVTCASALTWACGWRCLWVKVIWSLCQHWGKRCCKTG